MELNSKQKKIIICVGGIICVGICIFQFFPEEQVEITEPTVSAKNLEKIEEKEMIYIHVIGEVNSPGIIKVNEGARIIDVIESAGGITAQADLSQVNLAYIVSDGQKIKIPSIEEAQNINENPITYISQENGDNIIIEGESNSKQNEKVNISTANQTELETLTGIGPSIANKIITYRKENGKFKTIEDLKNVNGIGDAKYDAIKDYIEVK